MQTPQINDDNLIEPTQTFSDLGLTPALLRALEDLGHVTPTPIQMRTIPPLLNGRDVLGQAQTGTGKTGAFALPLLQLLDMNDRSVQALILAPTRELAIQVCEHIEEYARHMGQVGVLAIFGGDPIVRQLRRLEGTVRVVVGTPGRILDHLSRGSLKLDKVRMAVLDEADEMLRMGFVDDVEQILSQMPPVRRMALFSATMPPEIARIAHRYLRDPETIEVERRALTVATVDQRFIIVEQQHKLEALVRLLTVEEIDAVLVFARTRSGCAELAEMLENRGFASEAMHGDMAQSARQSVIRRLKNGQLRIVVATDVAARGLDVEKINLVVNADLPGESEVYVHRIGRTGRAGRSGKSVLFVTPREQRKLRDLERFTGQKIAQMPLPTLRDVQESRITRFSAAVAKTLLRDDLGPYRALLNKLLSEGTPMEDVAAALANLAWGDRPLQADLGADLFAPQQQRPEFKPAPRAADPRPPKLAPNRPPQPSLPAQPPPAERSRAHPMREEQARARDDRPQTRDERPQMRDERPQMRDERPQIYDDHRPSRDERPPMREERPQGGDRVWLSLGVGRRNGVRPQDIVGAIANEAGVPGQAMGTIEISDNFSLVQLPVQFVPQVLERMKRAMICGRFLQIRVSATGPILGMAQPEDRPTPPRWKNSEAGFPQPQSAGAAPQTAAQPVESRFKAPKATKPLAGDAPPRKAKKPKV